LTTYFGIVNPKIVITRNDLAINFFKIDKKGKKFKTVAMQNGLRDDEMLWLLEKYNNERLTVDYLFVLGDAIKKIYEQYITGKVISAGSLINNVIPKVPQRNEQRIVFISRYGHPGKIKKIKNEDFRWKEWYADYEYRLIKFLEKYAEKNSKQLVIIGAKPSGDEVQYYQNIIERDTVFLPRKDEFSSYREIDKAGVVVSIVSTLAYESIARGNRTAVFSIVGNDSYNFGWPNKYEDKGPFWTNVEDEKIYTEILDYLFEISDEEWENVRSNIIDDLMVMDWDNRIIKKVLDDSDIKAK